MFKSVSVSKRSAQASIVRELRFRSHAHSCDIRVKKVHLAKRGSVFPKHWWCLWKKTDEVMGLLCLDLRKKAKDALRGMWWKSTHSDSSDNSQVQTTVSKHFPSYSKERNVCFLKITSLMADDDYSFTRSKQAQNSIVRYWCRRSRMQLDSLFFLSTQDWKREV